MKAMYLVAAMLALATDAAAGGDTASANRIYRCEIDGKVVYGNAPCPQAPGREVDISVSRGYALPAKDAAASSDGKDAPPKEAPAPSAAATVGASAAEPVFDCRRLERDLRNNEWRSRQPQRGSVQDILTRERRELEQEKIDHQC